MSDESQPFKNGDRVVMAASEANEGDPPDGTTGVVISTNFSGVALVEWDDWTNHVSANEWFVLNDQITRVVSPP